MNCLLYIIITVRVRSTMEGYIFTVACLLIWVVTSVSGPRSLPSLWPYSCGYPSLWSHLLSRAVPQPPSFLVRGYPNPGWGYPSPRKYLSPGCRYPSSVLARGTPVLTGGSLVPEQGWGTHWVRTWVPPRSGLGYLPSWDWGITQDWGSPRTGYAMSGMPLVVSRRTFLFISKLLVDSEHFRLINL